MLKFSVQTGNKVCNKSTCFSWLEAVLPVPDLKEH